MGVELAVGYLIAWAVGKARRVAGRADAEVDTLLDAGMDRLHDVVAARLGGNPVLEQAAVEAAAGPDGVSEPTLARLRLAVEEAAGQDVVFARSVEQAVMKVGQAAQTAGARARAVYGPVFHGPAALQVGDHNTQTNTFGS